MKLKALSPVFKLAPVLVFLLITGCEKTEELSYSTHKIATDTGNCENDQCAKVKVNFPVATSSTDIAEKINAIIEDKIISTFIIDPDSKKEKTVEDAVENFKNEYLRDKEMQPDFAFGYEAEIQGEVLYRGTKLHSLAFSSFMYTGGAHGYSSLTYINIDPASGKTYDNDELFTDKEAFLKVAEQKFRKQEKIPEGSNINSTGFWFENDTYQLPENIGFTKDNIILHYNAYDISSYAEGGKTVEIPIGEIKQYLAILSPA
ncbi:DUF3298 and DUF4163 domain-containing protein [Sinomicrobium soli]|uniref:DUF3298 and DUF4163 domain-containing protein n=1 Tax=Sinomicrobium sp. N-1-3-6 TaxID=2219864 RepID=UPI000DCB3C32|nr:DUF3298 and DUF4163 domain-containing protein [Sinomicrobium sp. N-1-3-6]RAV29506.1 hypothetical protein DN748_08400 [Sinomicrobium sp. N-1-3-6]